MKSKALTIPRSFYTLFLYSLFIPQISFGQQALSYKPQIDSLKALFTSAASYKNMVRSYLSMSIRIQKTSTDKGLDFEKQVLQMTRTINSPLWESYTYMYLGGSYYALSKFDSSELLYREAINEFYTAKDTLGIINASKFLSLLLKNKNNLTQAIHFSIISMTLSEKIKNYRGIAINAMDIGHILKDQNKLNDATGYYKISLKYSLLDQNATMIANSLTSIGNVYAEKEDYDSSLIFYYMALDSEIQHPVGYPKASTLGSIGSAYMNKGQYDSALYYFQSAITTSNKISWNDGIFSGEVGMGEIFFLRGRYDSSIVRLNRILPEVKSNKSNKWLKEIYNTLTHDYESLDSFKTALRFLKLYSNVNDSLYNEENSQIVSDLQIQYETEKKEHAIAVLQKDSVLQNIIIYQKNTKVHEQTIRIQLLNQENKIKALQIDQKSDSLINAHLRAQADSIVLAASNQKLHDLRVQMILGGIAGTLSIITIAFILNLSFLKKRKKLRESISRDFHDELGETFTHINGDIDLISSKFTIKDAEVAKAFNNITKNSSEAAISFKDIVWATDPKSDKVFSFKEQFRKIVSRFEKSTKIRILPKINDSARDFNIEPMEAVNILRAFRTALNNAIQHSEASSIVVKLTIISRTYCVEINDNGQGFNLNERQNSGKGLNNIQRRMENIGGKCTIHTTPSGGTSVVLEGIFH